MHDDRTPLQRAQETSPHVTVVTQRSSRRIMGSRGARVNLCGAPATDLDVLLRDAKRMTAAQHAAWNVCPACLAEVK